MRGGFSPCCLSRAHTQTRSIPPLRLSAAWRNVRLPGGLRLQKSAHRLRHTLHLSARMSSAPASVQPLDCRPGYQILLRQREFLSRMLRLSFSRPAPYPQQSPQVNAGCCSRRRIKRVRNIDPCAHLSGLGHAGHKGQCNGGPPRAFRANQFGNRAYWKPTMQSLIQRVNARGGNRPHHPGCGRKRSGNPGGESRFNLQPDCGGGRHGEYFRLIFAFSVVDCKPPCTNPSAN